MGRSPAMVGWLGQPQLLLQGGPKGWSWLWAWLGCDWAERIARGQNSSPHYPMALLGISLMQALKLLLAATVGPGSGHPHSTPPPSWFQCTWLPCRAGRTKRLPQTQQFSGVSCPHTFPHLLVTSKWLSPTGATLSRRWSSGSREDCCPLWGVTRPGWTDPHTPVEGRPASSFVVCF